MKDSTAEHSDEAIISADLLLQFSVVRLGLCMSYFRFWPFEFA